MSARATLPVLLALALPSACTGTPNGGGGLPPEAGASGDAPSEAMRTCPIELPELQTLCTLAPSVVCSFGDPCSYSSYACRNEVWTEIVADASSFPLCPPNAPRTGETCASCGTSYRCTYDVACGAVTTAICSGGHWLSGTGPCDAGGAKDAHRGDSR